MKYMKISDKTEAPYVNSFPCPIKLMNKMKILVYLTKIFLD